MIPYRTFLAALLIALLNFGISPGLTAQSKVIELPPPDRAALDRFDGTHENQRFAAPLTLDLGPADGEWVIQHPTSARWELKLSVPTALGLALYLDRIDLPPGGQLRLENSAGIRGPFTSRDLSHRGRLFTGFLPGETITLIYEGPFFAAEQPAFHIWRADFAYRHDLFAPRTSALAALDFGASNDCHLNANCPEGDGFANEKSAVARIIAVAEEGSFYCSGSLVNNTAQDGRPLLLTAYHCQENVTALYDLWRFDFGYRSTQCSTPGGPPSFVSYDGSIYRSGREESDFLLLEIVDPDFNQADHYFNGWDRSEAAAPGNLRVFHHPQGDIQKVSTTTSAGAFVWNNDIVWENIVTPAEHHLRISVLEGSAESGSSGGPLFDGAGRIRGQMHGGNVTCPGSAILYFGHLFRSWTGGDTPDTRLSDWLDPLGTDQLTLDGATHPGNGPGRILRGTARWLGQDRIADVRFIFNWPNAPADTVFTDTDGYFEVVRPAGATSVTIATNYEDGDDRTGINILDIISVRRHILGLDTLEATQLVAADVTNNGNESVGDIIEISRVILSIHDWLNRPNWLVYPALINIEDGLPVGIFGPFDITIANPDDGIITLDFVVSKNGDVDGSVY